MPTVEFTTTIAVRGINPYVLVGKTRAATLKPGWRRPMPVLVQVNGHPRAPWHINMMPTGNGDFYLYLHGDVRQASNTKVGDKVTVRVAFDDAYQSGPQHPLPAWFRAALAQNAVAQANWEALPPSRQKEIVRYLAALKSPEAQARNTARALEVLSGKPGRFMARTWVNGA